MATEQFLICMKKAPGLILCYVPGEPELRAFYPIGTPNICACTFRPGDFELFEAKEPETAGRIKPMPLSDFLKIMEILGIKVNRNFGYSEN